MQKQGWSLLSVLPSLGALLLQRENKPTLAAEITPKQRAVPHCTDQEGSREQQGRDMDGTCHDMTQSWQVSPCAVPAAGVPGKLWALGEAHRV